MTTYFYHEVPCTPYVTPMFLPMPPINYPPPPLPPLSPTANEYPYQGQNSLAASAPVGGVPGRPPVEYEVVNGQHFYRYNVYPPNGRFPPGVIPCSAPLTVPSYGMTRAPWYPDSVSRFPLAAQKSCDTTRAESTPGTSENSVPSDRKES